MFNIKWIKYLFVLKRYLKLGVLLQNQLELLYSLHKEIGSFFVKFLLLILGKNFSNQNDV